METSRTEVLPPDTPKRVNAKTDYTSLLIGGVVSAVALGVVLYFADLGKLVSALQAADYRMVLLGAVTTVTWLVVRSYLWHALLRKKASVGTLFWTVNAGYLLNNLLPFRLGEFGRAYLVSRKAPVKFWEAISSIFIERILDLIFAAGLLLALLPFVVGAAREATVAVSTIALVLLVLVILYWMARNPDRVEAWFNWLVKRLPWLGRFGGQALSSGLQGLSVLTDPFLFFSAVGWAFVNWLVALLQYYVLLRAFFPQGEWLWSSFTLAVAALGIAAPSSPAAVGVFEAAVVGALSILGQDVSSALAMAFTAHLIQIIITGVLGAIALAKDGQSLSDLYRKVGSLRRRNPETLESSDPPAG